jgi:threonine synthase
VVVATSGDTGGAVAAGFHGVDGIEVVILYPKGKVSEVQELQLTTLGGNVTTLELHGTFDDCQALAKQALADAELRSRAHFTSANSINVARWLPQQFYYFYALKQWQGEPPIFSVPSGNFGNLAAGVLAHISGLPAAGYIAACNANDTIPNFMKDRKYDPKPSVSTLSSAMDVGDPSNFVRILEIFRKDFPQMASKIDAVSISDDETAATMRQVYREHGYVLDPHGAVAYKALADNLKKNGGRGIFLETAHPIKFDAVNDVAIPTAEPPEAIKALAGKPKHSIEMGVDYESFKELLISKI